MCRHFAWLGQDRSFDELIFKPSYGLPHQAARPRWQQIDLVNRDGFGVGWFPAEGHAVSYRRTGPIETDPDFPTLASEMSGGCVLGAVRGASPGMPIEEAATAPFTNGVYLLSLNGHLSVEKTLHLLEPGYEPESTCDAAFLAALLWQRLDQGRPLEFAVMELLTDITAVDSNACLNLLATDGVQVVATTWGETLCYRVSADGVLVASEPHDDADDWIRVEDRRVVIADMFGVEIRTLESVPETALEDLPATSNGILTHTFEADAFEAEVQALETVPESLLENLPATSDSVIASAFEVEVKALETTAETALEDLPATSNGILTDAFEAEVKALETTAETALEDLPATSDSVIA